MRLRKLQREDAINMLEWMQEEDVVHFLSANFSSKTIGDCIEFIERSQNFDKDMNLAIVNEENQYMGTVSLKHIDFNNATAEFAITVRKCAMGKGYAKFGMAEILKKGIEDLGLSRIYWCVSEANLRAVRFYDKNMYQRTDIVPETITHNYTDEQNKSLIWYIYPKSDTV